MVDKSPARRSASAPSAPHKARNAARTTVPDFDRLVHERARLGILSALSTSEKLTFSELKALLAISDGNLSVHARKLENAGYVAYDKSFSGRTPRTTFAITAGGRRAFEKYLKEMEGFIAKSRESSRKNFLP